MKENRSKAMALLVTLLMIGSAVVVMIPTATKAATTATKPTDVPKATVLPGQKNVVVLNFTVSEDGTDELVAGNPQPGKELTYGIDSNWTDNGMYFYDNGSNIWEATSDAIWIDDGNVYYDVGTGDIHIAGVSNENTGPGGTSFTWSIYFYDNGSGTWEPDSDAIWRNDGHHYYDSGTGDTHIAGVSNENTGPGYSDNPWRYAEQKVLFYDNEDDAWDATQDVIFLDKDKDGKYTAQADTLVDGDGSGSLGPGAADDGEQAGDSLTAFDSGDKVYADDQDNPKVVWIEGGDNNWFNATEDRLLLNTTGGNVDNTTGTNTTGTDVSTWSNWAFYDKNENGMYDEGEDIFIDYHNGGTYSAEAEEIAGGGSTLDGVDGELDNPWPDVFLYDDNDLTWESDSDAIWQDDLHTYYDDGKDDVIAGTSPPENTPADSMCPWNNVYFYNGGTSAWEEDSDAIWIDDRNVYYDDGKDTPVAGVPTENMEGQNTMPTGWDLKSYDASDGGAWDESADMIVFEDDDNGAYGDAITGVTISNEGTADATDIEAIELYMEEGTTPGFQADEDTLIGTFTLGESWTCDLSSSPITLLDESKTFYVVADISDTPTSGRTLQFKIPSGGIDVISSDTVPRDDLENANVLTIKKLGVDYFEGTTKHGAVDLLVTDTKNIKYGATLTLKVNTSCLSEIATGTYYVYYPCYKKVLNADNTYTYTLEWKPYYYSEDIRSSVNINNDDEITPPVTFNVSGIWILDNDASATGFTTPGGTDGEFAYFWVNGTEVYNIEISKTEVYYGKNESVTITVTEGDGSTPEGIWVDVRKEADDYTSPTLRRYTTNGTVTFTVDTDDFFAGNYTIFVYRDDEKAGGVTNNYDEDDGTGTGHSAGYTEWYGYDHPSISTSGYSALCGPWDPPEKVSAVKKIVVKTGEPTLEIPETNKTMYWNFSGEVKVYVKGYDGENLTVSGFTVKVYNSRGDDVTSNITGDGSGNIDKSQPGVIKISRTNWGVDTSSWYVWGTNGTWRIVVSYDSDGDGTEEWNGSVTFTVTQAPGVQIRIISPEDKEISAIPSEDDIPTKIWFQVLNREHGYLGRGDLTKDADNITLSGGALFLEEGKTLKEYGEILSNAYGYESSNDTWWVNIIPIMKVGGSELKISVDWGKWGTAEETILIGGTQQNGSVVSISPKEFYIGENVTFTVTVKDAEGDAYKNANITLYYMKDDGTLATSYKINETNGNGTSSGEYNFLFNVTQQTKNQSDAGFTEIKAPRYIVAYVDLPNVGYGYAVATMKPKSDLKVEISKNILMAGKKYDLWINISTVDPLTGNKTGTPDDTNLHVKIYNETGADVTSKFNNWSWTSLDGDATIELTDAYALEPGTYYIYAYNNTHNSEGRNATFEVKAVDVTPDLNELIWRYDDNVTVTFEVKWNDQPVNGTLKIIGVSDEGAYNLTWVNNSYIEADVVGGTAVVYNITASNLTDASIKNITFKFKPEGADQYANATGILPVRIPHVTATPDKIALGETATIEIEVTGRGEGLEGYNVTLKGPGNLNLTAKSDSHGIARFSFLPTATGEVDVYIENKLVPDVTIEITSHQLSIDAPSQVYEDQEFTVTVTDENDQPVEGAQVTFNGDTKQTDSNGQVTFTGAVFGNLPYATYTITAQKAGYKSAKTDITIVNVPQLYVSISPEGTLTSGQKFKVKVTSDTGAVYGVHVKVLKDGTVVAEGTVTAPEGVTLTAPTVSKETTYTVIVEKDGYKSAETEIKVKPGGIPGFELVTLIAAIGVAFILLRRRH